jgi:hypothetical protein
VSVWGAVLGVLALCAGAGALIARKLNALSPPATFPPTAWSSPTRDNSGRKLKTPAYAGNSAIVIVGLLLMVLAR